MKIRNVKNKRATFVASMRTDTVFNTHAFCTSSEFAESPVYYDALKLNSTTPTRHGPDTDRTRTKSAHVVEYELNSTTRTRPDPRGLCRRPAGTQRSFAAKKVRAGPCGSGRVRVGSVSGSCSGI